METNRRTARAVRVVLAAAPEEAQEVAVLYFVDELTQAEIAQEMGRSLPTIRKRLREFLACAREALGVPLQAGGDCEPRPWRTRARLLGPLRVPQGLLAGELSGVEKERTEAHVTGLRAGARRCGRRSPPSAKRLRRDVPFPEFAAGVAEKLAHRPGGTSSPAGPAPRRRGWCWWRGQPWSCGRRTPNGSTPKAARRRSSSSRTRPA